MTRERMQVCIYEDAMRASLAVSRIVAQVIRDRADQGSSAVLGLATGHTPIGVYRELIRMHEEEDLDFSHVITFNLDEYWPMDPHGIQSYHRWMQEALFKRVNIRPENIHIPSGTMPETDVAAHCQAFEDAIRDAGGIDLQILGIGKNGHIGFNEPGSPRDGRTCIVDLDKQTRRDAAADFFGEENVPAKAITMGIRTIFAARQICLLAFGEHKAAIIKQAVEGKVSTEIAASLLREHEQVTVYLDADAANNLTNIATPWMLGPCEWDAQLERRAVVWLAETRDKPILKLTDEDYAEGHLSELSRLQDGAYHANLKVFKKMMNTITGWPAGKQERRRILILSPHPDDDVICMGGTMMRLVEQHHEPHVAYLTSGSLAVFDHDVIRHAEFTRGFNWIFGVDPDQTATIDDHIEKFLKDKQPGEVDSPEVQQIKALIRRTEAIAAAKYCGLNDDQIHFLDMPFYHSGTVQKLPISDSDIALVRTLYERVEPQMIFAAGDMSDPHGTHRQCLEAALEALAQYVRAGHPEPELWFYRGAWQEWAVDEIDMAVPLSPDELDRKRVAIFRHESQKDQAMFPGPYDSREFWQRAEDRNMTTARIYDALGLPEYHAIESFVRAPLHRPTQVTSQFAT